MRSKDSQIINNVADAARKIMLGEEPDSQEFDQELKKTQTKASKKKTPEEEAGVSKALVQASQSVKVEDVNVFDLPLDAMSEEDVASLKSLTQEAMDAVPLSNQQSDIVEKINVIREKYGMIPLQTLNNKNQIGEDKEKLKKISKELAGASKMHKSQSERIEKMLPDVKSVDEAHGELHGGQKKLDMNKNNKVDAEDLKMLRAKKKPAKRTVTMDKPDRLVSMKVSKEAVEYVNEVEVLPKGVTRHKAKLAQGAKYGASDYGRGGEEEQTMKKAMTRKSEPKKRGSYGARQNIVRGTKVSGKDVNESASFFDKLTMLEEAPLEAISVSLKEGRMKDMVTGHMDAGHSYDSAMKKAQADMNKMKKPKPKQMSLPLNKQKANEDIDEGALGATAGAVGGAMMAGPVGAAVGGLVGHKAQQGIKKLGKKIKAGYQAFKRPQTAEAIEYMEEKKKKHSCASKVKNEEFGIGYCIPEMHTMLEDGTVTHYDVEFDDCIVEDFPVEELEILVSEMHEHYDNEEKNQLHELSPKALGSYTKKASQDLSNRRFDQGESEKRQYEPDAADDREEKRLQQREKGIKRAATKLVKKATNEEYDQLDELSPKTLGSYSQKSVRDLAKRDRAMGKATQRDREVVDPETSKPFQKMAKRRSGLTKAINRLSKEDILAAAYDEIEQLEEGTPSKKQVKQGIGIARDKRYAKGNMSGAVKAMDKVNKGLAQHPAVAKELRKQNEDIEYIDELKTPTLKSYISKASKDIEQKQSGKGYPFGIGKDKSKIVKRDLAIDKAKGRLSMNRQLGRPEESVQIDELDTKTLMSYRDKAEDDQVDRAMDMKGNTPKARKRAMGIEKAKDRLRMKAQKEEVEYIEEKNVPTNPKLWSRAKSLAKQKFDVYPSAYANGWASKWYKSKGGSWRKG